MTVVLLLRSADLRAGSAPPDPAWLVPAHQELIGRLLAPDKGGYPCHFGVRGEQEGNNWFTALDDRELAADPGEGAAEGAAGPGMASLARTMLEFRDRAWQGPKRQTLIAFVGPPDPAPDLDRDTGRFWRVLAALSMFDPAPWPHGYPSDVHDPAWQWCFAGEPWFVFGASPAYRARRSRNLGPCLTLVFQVRRVFEGLAGTSPAGQAAKRAVRDQLARYDEVGPHPHLGEADNSSVYKWRQYLLPDDQTRLDPHACPYRGEGVPA